MSDRNKTIGFIGMGMMGGGMAANLLKADFDMVAYDIDPAKNERFAGLGAKIANGPAGVAQGASTVICIVETTAQVREVVLGDGGIIEGAQEGDIFVCSATIDPLAVKEMHDILAEKGIKMLDAPVSGGVPRAVSGDLSIIVGGDGAVVDACRPYFDAMSANVFHMGEIGHGLAMKLCNNMITQVTKVVIAEAMALGAKAGLDPQQMVDVISVSTGNSDSFRAAAPRYSVAISRPAAPLTSHIKIRNWKRDSPRRSACRCSWPLPRNRFTRWRAPPASTKRTAVP